MSSLASHAAPGTASTRAGACDGTDSRSGLRCRPEGRRRAVRIGRASPALASALTQGIVNHDSHGTVEIRDTFMVWSYIGHPASRCAAPSRSPGAPPRARPHLPLDVTTYPQRLPRMRRPLLRGDPGGPPPRGSTASTAAADAPSTAAGDPGGAPPRGSTASTAAADAPSTGAEGPPGARSLEHQRFHVELVCQQPPRLHQVRDPLEPRGVEGGREAVEGDERRHP